MKLTGVVYIFELTIYLFIYLFMFYDYDYDKKENTFKNEKYAVQRKALNVEKKKKEENYLEGKETNRRGIIVCACKLKIALLSLKLNLKTLASCNTSHNSVVSVTLL